MTAVYRTISILAIALAICLGLDMGAGLAESPPPKKTVIDLTQLSLEDLMNIEITSAAKKSQNLSQASAAVFVITQQDLRRSGVTTIADALRMVPGMHVAQIDRNKWAISTRGFNGRFANKLLVLMDGRVLYEPTFSGVFWDAQDTLLEDIQRIEVIRGPGASLWGANAVNGVINIITRSAAETAGTLVTGGVGTDIRALLGLRHGGQMGSNGAYRIYAKAHDYDSAVDATGNQADDDWRSLRGGFRTDWPLARDGSLTIQGEAYRSNLGGRNLLTTQTPPDYFRTTTKGLDVNGAHLLGRWIRRSGKSQQTALQVYFDHADREEAVTHQRRSIFDVEFQHNAFLNAAHALIWGLGYRYTSDKLTNSPSFEIDPTSRQDSLFSGFIQDDIQLVADRLRLTLGARFEHNDYTGFEIQPTARLLASPHNSHTFWLAFSRAVRTPARFEVDLSGGDRIARVALSDNGSTMPIRIKLTGNKQLGSAELLALEGGYRTMPAEFLGFDAALFFYRYDDLYSTETLALKTDAQPPEIHLEFDNKMVADAYGFELAADFSPSPIWQLRGSYALFAMDHDFDADSNDMLNLKTDQNVPRHQASLRSQIQILPNLEFDLWLRYVDEVASIDMPSYLALDMRLGWWLRPNLELALVGQNLFSPSRPEYTDNFYFTENTEVVPSGYIKLTWRP